MAFNLPSEFGKIEDMEIRFQESREMAKIFVAEVRYKQKLGYDASHQDYEFQLGQTVLVFTKQRTVGESEKLLLSWFGPYGVIKKIGRVTYDCRDLRTSYIDRAHVSRIKPYYLGEIEEDSIWVDNEDTDLRTISEELTAWPQGGW